MDSNKAKLFLLDYLNGHLGDDERQEVERALEADPALRMDLESLKMEVSLLKNSIEDPMEEVHLTNINESVMNEIRKKKVTPISDYSPAWRSYVRAAAALLVIIIGVTILFQFSPGGLVKKHSENHAENRESSNSNPDLENAMAVDEKPEVVKLTLATSDPKIKIHWTMSSDFEPLTQED